MVKTAPTITATVWMSSHLFFRLYAVTAPTIVHIPAATASSLFEKNHEFSPPSILDGHQQQRLLLRWSQT